VDELQNNTQINCGAEFAGTVRQTARTRQAYLPHLSAQSGIATGR